MLKKELASHYLVSLIWLVIITLLRWDWRLNLIWLWGGGLLGSFWLDWADIFYQKAIGSQEEKSPFHNALFQVVFFVFCFWVLTSTGSLFGKGLVMAMALHLLKDEFHLLLAGREEQLRGWLFWPIRREVSFQEQKFFVILMLLVFLGLNIFLI